MYCLFQPQQAAALKRTKSFKILCMPSAKWQSRVALIFMPSVPCMIKNTQKVIMYDNLMVLWLDISNWLYPMLFTSFPEMIGIAKNMDHIYHVRWFKRYCLAEAIMMNLFHWHAAVWNFIWYMLCSSWVLFFFFKLLINCVVFRRLWQKWSDWQNCENSPTTHHSFVRLERDKLAKEPAVSPPRQKRTHLRLKRGCANCGINDEMAGRRLLSRAWEKVLITMMQCSCSLLPDSGTPAHNHQTNREKETESSSEAHHWGTSWTRCYVLFRDCWLFKAAVCQHAQDINFWIWKNVSVAFTTPKIVKKGSIT